MKPNPELTKKLVELYANGRISIKAVASIVGLTDSAVWYHLKKGGAVMRRRGDAIKSRLGALEPRLAATEHPTTWDIAWAAGIFEGEGSTVADRRKLNVFAMALVCQKERWLCDRFKMLFGGSITVQHQQTTRNPKPITMHYWRLTGARARGFLMTVYPFLSPHRQAKIREALNVIRKAA